MLDTTSDAECALKEQFFGRELTGYFVEVGANDPQFESQTWHLEQRGWTGTLVEPQPDLAERLRRERRARVFAVACSSPENAGRTLPFHVAGALSSLNRDRMAPGAKPRGTIDVPIMTLDQILEQAEAPSPIDFLSIDVEGHELEVLRGLTLTRWRPRLILLEDHVGHLQKLHFMQGVGYRLVRHSHYNGWYVPKDSPVDFGWKDRWRILRKYYLNLPFRMLRDGSRRVRRRLLENREGAFQFNQIAVTVASVRPCRWLPDRGAAAL
jgi:FkbM family methyltransferase